MERLSLDDFKMKSNNSNELEQLSGGILGACHVSEEDKKAEQARKMWEVMLNQGGSLGF